jgi:hypothetical protein
MFHLGSKVWSGEKNDRLRCKVLRLLLFVHGGRPTMGTREDLQRPIDSRDIAYRHYHAEPIAFHGGSCWEKHQIEREMARTAA